MEAKFVFDDKSQMGTDDHAHDYVAQAGRKGLPNDTLWICRGSSLSSICPVSRGIHTLCYNDDSVEIQ